LLEFSDITEVMRNSSLFGNKRGRILLLLPEIFGSPGGIQAFCRSFLFATELWAERNDSKITALVLNDLNADDPQYIKAEVATVRGFARSKPRFLSAFLRTILISDYDLIVAGHVSISPMLFLASLFTPRARRMLLTYGVEVWRDLNHLQQAGMKAAHSIVAISDFTKSQVAERNKVLAEKISILPCCLDAYWSPDGAFEARVAEPPMILTVGRLESYEKYKGVDSVIECLPSVVQAYGKVNYTVVGGGTDIPRLKELAADRGVADCVLFTGRVSDEELRDLYRKCTVFVMPSEKEGFGIVFLEAMAYAKPVIGGAHAGTPSVITNEENGLLVERTDIESLSKQIIRVISNRDMQRRLGFAGRDRLLREFTFSTFASNLGSIYNLMLSS